MTQLQRDRIKKRNAGSDLCNSVSERHLREEFNGRIFDVLDMGISNKDLAETLGISTRTLCRWKDEVMPTAACYLMLCELKAALSESM